MANKDKELAREYNKKYKIENRDKINEIQRRYTEKNRAAVYDRNRRYKEKNPEKFKKLTRLSWMRRVYGLTEESFNSMLLGQGGVCAICKKDDWGQQGPHIDHDHETNDVRGILCHYCNAGLGHFRDNPEYMASAIKYIESSR